MKLPVWCLLVDSEAVAPLVGAWIEIFNACFMVDSGDTVAPLVGAWIEIVLFKR